MALDLWVRQQRRAKGIKQSVLGRAVGKDQSWISRIENGLIAGLSVDEVVALGEALGDPDGALAAARKTSEKTLKVSEPGEKYADPLSWIGPDVDVSGLHHIPFFPAGASAGVDRIRDGYIPPETAADVLPNNVRTIQVHGDCMRPHYEDGDIVFVNETDRAADGDKVIALVDMTARTCKVFRSGDPKAGRRPYLEPTNGEGQIEAPRFRVHGVVIGFYRGEKRM